MDNIRKAVGMVSTSCFLTALFAYVVINELVLSSLVEDQRLIGLIVGFLSAVGVYSVIFQLSYWLYSKYLFKRLDRRMDLSGTWYQIFLIANISDARQRIRHGVCSITSDMYGVTISAKNHRADDEHTFSSSWQSEVTTVVGRKLIILWVSEGVRRENAITRGTMVLHIHGERPTQLIGNFNDASPAMNRGTMTIYREKGEYEAELAKLLGTSA